MRFFDIFFSMAGFILLSPILLILLIIGYYDTGYPIFKQERVGRFKKPFYLLKFRSMYIDTKSVGTHEVNMASITKWGRFLRKSKLDELPQLWNVLVGDMSLVGPRPNLYNQEELITERDKHGVYSVRPGITGLAQIQKIDMSTPGLLAVTDQRMIQSLGFYFYFKFIFITAFGKGWGDSVQR